MKAVLKRYRGFFLLLAVQALLALTLPDIGLKAASITRDNLVQMLTSLPPIFVLLGLLDVWTDRETMMRLIGRGAGLRGTLLAAALGSFSAGPLYGAFPMAAMMLRKGASVFNVMVFIGTWGTAKVSMLSFEAASMGLRFTLSRLAMSAVGILLIAWLIEHSLSDAEQAALRTSDPTSSVTQGK